jgi:hypothetical protein
MHISDGSVTVAASVSVSALFIGQGLLRGPHCGHINLRSVNTSTPHFLRVRLGSFRERADRLPTQLSKREPRPAFRRFLLKSIPFRKGAIFVDRLMLPKDAIFAQKLFAGFLC